MQFFRQVYDHVGQVMGEVVQGFALLLLVGFKNKQAIDIIKIYFWKMDFNRYANLTIRNTISMAVVCERNTNHL